MELVLPYAFCKLHGIALVNDNKVSTLIEPILNEGTSDKIKKPKL